MSFKPLVAARGLELAYAEIQANFASPTNAATDVPGLAITVVEGIRPYMLKAWTYGLAGSVLDQYVYLRILDADSGNVLSIGQHYVTDIASTAGEVTTEKRMPMPTTPGTTRHFKVSALGGGTSHPTIQADPTAPAFLQAIEI